MRLDGKHVQRVDRRHASAPPSVRERANFGSIWAAGEFLFGYSIYIFAARKILGILSQKYALWVWTRLTRGLAPSTD